MRRSAREFLPGMLGWIGLDVAWGQRYTVTTFCRILHTLDTGQVTSKRAALLWAQGVLDPQWAGLIQQVLDDRPLGWADGAPARPGSAAQTLAFAEYTQARARAWPVPG